MRQAFKAITLAALTALAACATPGAADRPADFARALEGVWDNSAQMSRAPESMRGEGPPGAAWIAPRVFEASAQEAVALVAWRGPAGEDLGRERWAFRETAAGFELEIAPENAASDPECALAVRPLGQGLFDAASDPVRCRVARAGRPLGLERRVTNTSAGLLHQEIYWDGPDEIAFKVPGATPLHLRRRP